MRARNVMSAIATALLGVGLVSASAGAYGFSGGGGRLGYTTPEDLNSTVMVGGHVEFEQHGTRLHLQPNLIYWKNQGLSDVNPNLDVYYHFGRDHEVTPYLGGGMGLNMRHDSFSDRSDTDVSANMIGGIRFPGRTNDFFVESRVTAGDVSQVALLGGITFAVR